MGQIDFSPLWVTLKTGIVASVFSFFIGIAFAELVINTKGRVRAFWDGLLTLPMVLPPTVAGYILLRIFSTRRPFGSFLSHSMGIQVVHTWLGCVVAATIIALPLMYRNARAAFEQIDEKQYSDNPIVDSVLRIKFGRAKARGIKVETSIRIPKKMQLDHGDIGVLYGNLVDNAVEACSKVPEEQRFVKIENKYQSGILLLVITNSKTGKKNKSLKTTKKDNIRHGHGVQSVRKVVEKYNGTVSFTDKGDIFEVSAMLYGIEVKE